MSDMPVTPPPPQGPWAPDPGRRARGSRMLKVAVGVGAAAGIAVGATALAQAATSSSGPPQSAAAAAVTASGSTTTTLPPRSRGFAGPGGRLRGPGGFGGLGALGGPGVLGGGLGAGPLIDGQFTVKGPNGYETIAERSGTVSDVTDTSGSTWTLTVKSADGSSGTFTVDTGTSVNGGETGIGSVKTGDTVQRDRRGLGGNRHGQAGHRRNGAEGQRCDVATDAPLDGLARLDGHCRQRLGVHLVADRRPTRVTDAPPE